MRRIVIQCERCEKQYNIPESMGNGEWANVANGWLTLHEAHREDRHYCSAVCLVKSLDVVSIYSALVQTQQQASQANKIRRFVATDGYKDLEGVKWSNGRVGVMCLKKGCSSYESWDAFKLYHPGCEITWIDQEVSSDN